MHCAILIPDWNSLDSVRHAHSALEAAALIFFALLVLFDVLAHLSKEENRTRLLEKIALGFFAVAVFAEIAAYPYGQRNDTLSAQVIGSLDVKAQSALNKSSIAETKAAAASKQYDDLLAKYTAAAHEITELKAAKLPRRLSSNQKEILRKRVALFAIKNIVVSCANGGAEAFDFAQDFVDVFFHKPLAFGGQYSSSCSEIMGAVVLRIPSLQIEVGADRQGDATILTKALAEIGINKKQIVTQPNTNAALLVLTVGPKAE